MMNHKESIIEKGIVLSVSNYLDDSAISNVITNNGIYQVIIRHGYKIKSDLKNLLIPFNYVDLELKNNKDKLFNATYCKVIKDYSNGFNNYVKNLFLQCIIQLTLSLFHLEDKFNIEYLIDIFKYVLKDINNETLNKIVPKDEGIKILTKLTKHLEDYFGISKLSSINNFISFLINEK